MTEFLGLTDAKPVLTPDVKEEAEKQRKDTLRREVRVSCFGCQNNLALQQSGCEICYLVRFAA